MKRATTACASLRRMGQVQVSITSGLSPRNRHGAFFGQLIRRCKPPAHCVADLSQVFGALICSLKLPSKMLPLLKIWRAAPDRLKSRPKNRTAKLAAAKHTVFDRENAETLAAWFVASDRMFCSFDKPLQWILFWELTLFLKLSLSTNSTGTTSPTPWVLLVSGVQRSENRLPTPSTLSVFRDPPDATVKPNPWLPMLVMRTRLPAIVPHRQVFVLGDVVSASVAC